MTDLVLTHPAPQAGRPLLPARRRDPFRVDGPTMISFSGGRTSGYMLRRILDAHGGELPPDTHVVFANTGKEREETLAFVRDVETQWGVRVRWVEWRNPSPETWERTPGFNYLRGFEEVGFRTAARKGEPFARLIDRERCIPNTHQRFCTRYLKIAAAQGFMRWLGYDHWTNFQGIRADEPRRVAKALGRPQDDCELVALPLYDANAGLPEITRFWRAQPFDLQLAAGDGNCDLCFLFGANVRLNRMRREPWRAEWWLRQQAKIGHGFIKPGRPSYEQLHHLAVHQIPAVFEGEDTVLDCVCGE